MNIPDSIKIRIEKVLDNINFMRETSKYKECRVKYIVALGHLEDIDDNIDIVMRSTNANCVIVNKSEAKPDMFKYSWKYDVENEKYIPPIEDDVKFDEEVWDNINDRILDEVNDNWVQSLDDNFDRRSVIKGKNKKVDDNQRQSLEDEFEERMEKLRELIESGKIYSCEEFDDRLNEIFGEDKVINIDLTKGKPN